MSQIQYYGEKVGEGLDGESRAYIEQIEDERGEVFRKIVLPHSCQEWIIGGEKEARELIKDLEDLIQKL